MVIVVAFLLKGIFIAINSIDPHTKELVGNRIYFIDFCNNVFFKQFFSCGLYRTCGCQTVSFDKFR